MRDRMGSFFSEWKEFTLLSRANQAQQELCEMVQTLEQQLVALNLAGMCEPHMSSHIPARLVIASCFL